MPFLTSHGCTGVRTASPLPHATKDGCSNPLNHCLPIEFSHIIISLRDMPRSLQRIYRTGSYLLHDNSEASSTAAWSLSVSYPTFYHSLSPSHEQYKDNLNVSGFTQHIYARDEQSLEWSYEVVYQELPSDWRHSYIFRRSEASDLELMNLSNQPTKHATLMIVFLMMNWSFFFFNL